MPIERVFRVAVDDGGFSGLIHEQSAAENEAIFYLKHNPKAIVMLVEVQKSTCEHCNQIIVEKAGWIVHQWLHLRTGMHLCFMAYTQATPKEG